MSHDKNKVDGTQMRAQSRDNQKYTTNYTLCRTILPDWLNELSEISSVGGNQSLSSCW